jgi:hypothetical protein
MSIPGLSYIIYSLQRSDIAAQTNTHLNAQFLPPPTTPHCLGYATVQVDRWDTEQLDWY